MLESLATGPDALACPCEHRGHSRTSGYRSSQRRRARASISHTRMVPQAKPDDPLPAIVRPLFYEDRPMSESHTSQRQLHTSEHRCDGSNWTAGREAVWGGSRRRAAALNGSEPLCRPVWSGQRAYERDARNPGVDQDGSGGRSGGTVNALTRGGLYGSAKGGRWEGRKDDLPMPVEKSESFIVAMRPVKAGGAKGGLD